MYYVKKAQALHFLMELLFVAGFVLLLMFFASKIVSSESKELQFDAYNLALFLERIPSIEGNLEHRFEFEKEIYLEINKDSVSLDKTKNNKRFVEAYQNPEEYQFEEEFEKISYLYVYKIGSNIEFRTDEDANLRKQLGIKPELISSENSEEKTLVSFDTGSSFGSIFDVADFIPDNSKIYWLHETNLDNEMVIYYTDQAKSKAYNFYNLLIGTSYSSRVNSITTIPLQDYSVLLDKFKDEINTNTQLEIINRFEESAILIIKAPDKSYEGFLER